MFEPGHLHLVSLPGLDQQDINIHIRYEVRQNAESGAYVHFDMDGEIDGKPFSDSFELPRDTAFNFASDATRVAQKHGLHPKFGAITRVHKEYDAMFEDIRAKLHAHPANRWISSGSFATSEPCPRRPEAWERPDIDDIGPFFVCRKSRSRGLPPLPASGNGLPLAASGLPLNKLKLLNIKVFNNLARALLKCWRRKPHRQTGSQP